MTKNPIACELHDYLEIACLYKYKVKLYLKSRQIWEGEAVDIDTQDKIEYLIIDDGQRRRVALTDLDQLEVLTPGAKFREVIF